MFQLSQVDEIARHYHHTLYWQINCIFILLIVDWWGVQGVGDYDEKKELDLGGSNWGYIVILLPAIAFYSLNLIQINKGKDKINYNNNTDSCVYDQLWKSH